MTTIGANVQFVKTCWCIHKLTPSNIGAPQCQRFLCEGARKDIEQMEKQED